MTKKQNEVENGWQGSETTFELVKAQIEEKFGVEHAEKYDPTLNCFTFHDWQKLGMKVKKGEKALKSFTYIPAKDKNGKPKLNEEGKAIVYKRTVCLFYVSQVEKMSDKQREFIQKKLNGDKKAGKIVKGNFGKEKKTRFAMGGK